MEPMEMPRVSTASSTITDYVATIRAIRDAFKYHTGPIKKRHATENTMYFILYYELWSHGGFTWHSAFSSIKPGLSSSLTSANGGLISLTPVLGKLVSKSNSSLNVGWKVAVALS